MVFWAVHILVPLNASGDLSGSSGEEPLAAESPRSIRFPGRSAPLAILQSLFLTRIECDRQAVAPTVFSA
jgi:hypothetical protein